ncbi:MAG: hypothetical protein ABF759_12425 [Acetobacter malorum]|uniref:hypothetical protein n=1 Tax=Acetobacter malorum TaxID=178901 RepID=UPI0039E74CC9
MEHRQKVCRGGVVLYGGRLSLVVAANNRIAAIVPLTAASIPRYRADVLLPALCGLSGTTARCADLAYEKLSDLKFPNETSSVCFGKEAMALVDAAIRLEQVARAAEELPPGIVRSTFRPVWGSRGRKVGGPPSD